MMNTLSESLRKISHVLTLLPVFLLVISSQNSTLAQTIAVKHTRFFDTEMQYPTDIHRYGNHRFLVLDGMNNRIGVYDSNGLVRYIVPQTDSIYRSVGFYVENSVIWVADPLNHRIVLLDGDGATVRTVDLLPETEPVDLVVTGETVIVSDRKSRSLLALKRDGSGISPWSKRKSGLNGRQVIGMLASYNGTGFLAGDLLYSRVLLLSPDGSVLKQIAGSGVQQGTVFRPKGIDTGKKRIWIADGYTGSLQAFTSNGKFTGAAAIDGKPLLLTTPAGLAVTDDTIWIVESRINRISVYTIME